MADKKISDLTAVASIAKTNDELAVVQSPGVETKKATVDQIAASLVQRGAGSFSAPTSIVTVPFSYVIGSERLEVYYNGILQERVEDYTETSTTTVTFTDTLSSSDKVYFRYI